MAKDYRKTNPHSFKEIVGMAMGEYVCAEHLGARGTLMPKGPEQGICWACALDHKEPRRKELIK